MTDENIVSEFIDVKVAECDRHIAALEELLADFRVLRDELAKGPPQPEPCCRCGQPYGGRSAHGPGFCIDRRTEVERQQEKEPERARRVHPPVVADSASAPRTGRLSDIAAQLDPIVDPETLEETVRDAVCDQKKPFRENVLMERLNVSRLRARELVLTYVEKGMLRHVSGIAATARYEYVPPPNTAPNVRPRGDARRENGAGAAPVAGTGKAKANGSVTGTRRPGRTHGGKK